MLLAMLKRERICFFYHFSATRKTLQSTLQLSINLLPPQPLHLGKLPPLMDNGNEACTGLLHAHRQIENGLFSRLGGAISNISRGKWGGSKTLRLTTSSSQQRFFIILLKQLRSQCSMGYSYANHEYSKNAILRCTSKCTVFVRTLDCFHPRMEQLQVSLIMDVSRDRYVSIISYTSRGRWWKSHNQSLGVNCNQEESY